MSAPPRTPRTRTDTAQALGVERSDHTRPASARISLGRLALADSSNYLLLLGVTLFLVVFGLVMVLSSSSIESWTDDKGFFGGFWKQATYAVIGVPLMLVMSRMPLEFWKKIAWPAIFVAIALQALVFSPLGIEDYGNRNWIRIGSISGQPSEFVKLALVVWLAFVLSRKRELLTDWRHALIPVVPIGGLAIGLVLLGRDLGTVLILASIVFAALYFAGVRWRILIPVMILAGIGAAVAVGTSANRMNRLMSFLDAECSDYEGVCWQPLHGTWALANGGLFGVGLGNSVEKWDWLPAASNDYIFAIVGEELGLVGAVVLLLMFVLLAVAFLRVIRSSDDPFVRTATGAVLMWIIGQAFVNIGVVLRVFPVLGVPLPFISAGGTALITSLMAVGIVLSFARHEGRRATLAMQGRGSFR
ncbi:cell division-specific peptidoglycan biosynthesis regulator FtsW [Labedella gwakjiensis]|uniref:Probable peptidoglycan glycosyltransferase FtsW n=1 Tax=Labedella gwakjiensis TaxID=390269 RepID=A0A2P8GZH9_9MICO|nr:putative lipid II flippase FtsW [Labedella gwakjiensis]PSL39374.1 cell division-specific peptidoglycan biosynthesis regulator FtsW [Labedella gwakjiensis]RUQ86215.1 putative lipid II flippase FtsW [Labedella gwakjiensis]